MSDLRNWLNLLCEAVAADDLAKQKATLLPELMNSMDHRSVAAVLEWEGDDDTEALADAWFDSCINIYKHIEQHGKCPIFRHMMVENFRAFVQALAQGTGRLGEYWSIHYGIESPTWKQDQHGEVAVNIEGEIKANQVDWMATLRQNFEWPHEFELIFAGDVFVVRIENGDTGAKVSPKRWYKR